MSQQKSLNPTGMVLPSRRKARKEKAVSEGLVMNKKTGTYEKPSPHRYKIRNRAKKLEESLTTSSDDLMYDIRPMLPPRPMKHTRKRKRESPALVMPLPSASDPSGSDIGRVN